MIQKNVLFWICLVTILTVTFLVMKFGKQPVYKKGSSAVYDLAISSAKTVYKKRLSEGWDVSRGPCITNDLMPGWVADLVHSPRENADDLPENQCQAFLEGRSKHFVELDLNGNLVRVQ